jgi:hypothetical protein
LALTAVLLLSVAAAQGAEVEEGGPRKPAWKWTLDERLAARFDPGAMAARDAELQAEEEAARKRWSNLLAGEEAQMKGPSPATETIDGSKTPELFLPGELFGMLLYRGLPQEEKREGLQESRGRIEERAAALGFGRDLWDRLDKVAAPYLRLLHDEERRSPLSGAEDSKAADLIKKEVSLRLCRARAQALEAAKAEFGEEAFLRLLYEALAPIGRRIYVLEPWPPDYQRHAEELRLEEGGCR